MYKTLSQRKQAEADRRAGAVQVLSERLRTHARERGGRFLLYGSAARGEIRFDSDIDLLIDFAAEAEAEAWRQAEAACAEMGMRADIRPVGLCAPDFLARVMPQAVVLA